MSQLAAESPSKTAPEPPQRQLIPGLGFRAHLGWVASLFLVCLSAKFWFILTSGTPLPYADQWDGEATNLFIPYFEGHLSLAKLLSGHGQHRIFFTRIVNLGLLLLNGQWDNQLEAVVNAIIHCLGIAGLGWLMAGLMGRKHWPFIWLPLALALVPPFAWDNTLWGFQSQFYFLLFLSLLAIGLLDLSRPLSFRWWLGGAVAFAALFTMASGFLAPVTVLGLAMVDILKRRDLWRRRLPTLTLCTAVAGVGFILHARADMPSSYQFLSHSVAQFLVALGRDMAWPWVDTPWAALGNLFPLAVFAWIYFRSREAPLPAERMILGVGIWVVLQALGLAYARGGGGFPAASRYLDICCFIMVVDCWCIAMLLTRHRQRLRFVGLFYASVAVWALGCLTGLWWLTERAWRVEIADQDFCYRARLKSMRDFLATDKTAVLALPGDCLYLPIAQQARLLRNPIIRRILPSCLREPLKIIPKPDGDPAFVPNGCVLDEPDSSVEPCWGSFSGQGANARGQFESLPMESSLPFLEIPVAGDLGKPGLSLELVDLATGKATAVNPARIPGKRWVSVYVRAPAGDFKVVAKDETEDGWLAFRQPREVGRLSLWAVRLLGAWKYFLGIGAGCLVLQAVTLIRRPNPGD